ncbi:MAG TPA: MFS transporter [Alphaproteobacteria bacterium]|nr:MFS transporter [Alphaproteobacteria bacterium]
MHGTQPLRAAKVAGGALKRRSLLTLPTLCAAVLIVQVDTSVVNLAIQPIGDYFHAGVGALQWVMDAYNLFYAVLLLTGGLLADLYGRRLIFMAGTTVFALASLLCTAAPSVSTLIVGRALAGVGAALLLPASLAIVRVVWKDERERRRALGIWAGCNGMGWAIGPTVGGLLIHSFGWRSIFLIAVPLAAAAFVTARFAIPESSDPHGRRFDAGAQVLGAFGLGCLALAAIESQGNMIVAGIAFVLALLAVAFFIRIEAGEGAGALVPLDMFRLREFRGAIAATGGMTFGMYGGLFLLTLTWQSTGRFDAVAAGLALVPMALVFVVVSPFSGALTGRFGSRLTTAGGVGIIGCGWLLVGFTAHMATVLATEAGLLLTGIGMGLATGPLSSIAVGSVSAARSGTAAALINVTRMIGATMGVAILGAVFALAHGGLGGLRIATLLAGAVQLLSALIAWRDTRQRSVG